VLIRVAITFTHLSFQGFHIVLEVFLDEVLERLMLLNFQLNVCGDGFHFNLGNVPQGFGCQSVCTSGQPGDNAPSAGTFATQLFKSRWRRWVVVHGQKLKT